jgi:hypothetical protein
MVGGDFCFNFLGGCENFEFRCVQYSVLLLVFLVWIVVDLLLEYVFEIFAMLQCLHASSCLWVNHFRFCLDPLGF